MTITNDIQHTTTSTWDGRIDLAFQTLGQGPPLVYLHPGGGLEWDGFLQHLATRYTVHAPVLPGTELTDSFAIHELDDVFDLVLAYEQALRARGLTGIPLIGQSFGGMIAAELAAVFPDLVDRLVLLDPAGLWDESYPWSLDFMWSSPEQVAGKLFHDLTSPAVQAALQPPHAAEDPIEFAVGQIWGLGCVAKFLWPVPDRGLRKRLHRVAAPSLVVWGENDQLIPAAYAEDFGALIPDSTVEIIPNCGHVPQVEQQEQTIRVVEKFLAGA